MKLIYDQQRTYRLAATTTDIQSYYSAFCSYWKQTLCYIHIRRVDNHVELRKFGLCWKRKFLTHAVNFSVVFLMRNENGSHYVIDHIWNKSQRYLSTSQIHIILNSFSDIIHCENLRLKLIFQRARRARIVLATESLIKRTDIFFCCPHQEFKSRLFLKWLLQEFAWHELKEE